MRNFAVLLAMVAGFTIVLGPASGLLGATPVAGPRIESVVSAVCVHAFAAAAQRSAPDAPADILDEAIRSCASLEEWSLAAEMHPETIGGRGPRTFLEARCTDPATGLARYATCRDLGKPLAAAARGSISVSGPSIRKRLRVDGDVGVEVILPRIAIAKDSLSMLVKDALPQRTLFAIRTFGGVLNGGVDRCRTRLPLPMAPLDRRAALDLVGDLSADKRTSTPIAASLAAVADDLAGIAGRRNVILVTEGNETCGGDPLAEIERLRGAWPDLTLNVVGISADEGQKQEFAGWAEAGGGRYFEASSADELAAAIASAITGSVAPGTHVRIVRPDGALEARGSVGGKPLKVSAGTYRVEVLADPLIVFADVVVGGGHSIELRVPEPA